MRFIVGIDPGASGAICVLNNDGTIFAVYDMPVNKETSQKRVKAKKGSEDRNGKEVKTVLKVQTKTTIDNVALFNLIPQGCAIALEQVAAMPGQGVTSMFSFGSTFGAIKMAAEVKGDTVKMVRPNEWQKFYGLTMSKEEKGDAKKSEVTKKHKSIIASKASGFYPAQELLTSRGTLLDGRADAIMIARWLFDNIANK